MSRGTLDPAVCDSFSLTGLSPSLAGLSRTFLLNNHNHSMQSEPQGARTLVWALSGSLAATSDIEFSFRKIFSFLSSGYLDVSVHRVPSLWLWIYHRVLEVCSSGFPHSDIHGSKVICTSPWLFAAYHVFHRLLVPRHPPCALSCLTSFKLANPLGEISSFDRVPSVALLLAVDLV